MEWSGVQLRVSHLVESWCDRGTEIFREPIGRGESAVGSRCQKTDEGRDRDITVCVYIKQ
jgi:hypothetical protein